MLIWTVPHDVSPDVVAQRSHVCPVCEGRDTRSFLRLDSMPVLIGVQWPDAESARACRKGDILLAFCRGCGFIWNVLFDPARLEYQQSYDNSLHFSAVFQLYTRGIVERLVKDYGLRRKRIIDIGCGKGDFLAMLCEAGDNDGFGFDPSYEGERAGAPTGSSIRWFQESYGARHTALQADLIASRYVLEHIPRPLEFLEMLCASIADAERTAIYFEVPNADLILRQHSVWDVIYEHCSYFSVESLPRTFERAGFRVLGVAERYEKQFLSIDARPRGDAPEGAGNWGDLAALDADVSAFGEVAHAKLEGWRRRLRAWRADGARVVAWGAGAKAVGFLNMLGVRDEIACVVDVNPHKHGKHLAGTGHLIVSPRCLRDLLPNVVVLMNPIYREEIERQLLSMNLRPRLMDA